MKLHHLESHCEEQITHSQLIATAVDNLLSIGLSNVTSQRIEVRRTALNEAWNKFSSHHDAINISLRKLGSADKIKIKHHDYFKENIFNATYEAYLEALETMNSLMIRKTKEDRSPSIQSTSQVSNSASWLNYGPRLPYLNLPSFDGTPSEWLSFKDLFDSMILSSVNLSPVCKLHYLKQCLKGSAAHFLKKTTLTNDNFQKAWDSLVSFYENKRLLGNSAIQSLFMIKKITKESAIELEKLYTSIIQIHRSLETLGRPVENYDDFFIFITIQRLDEESVKAWEHHLGPSKEPPTWNQFKEFLMTRLLTLQAVEKSRKIISIEKKTINQSFKVHQTLTGSFNQIKCPHCQDNHFINQCSNFKNSPVQRRIEIVSRLRLCYNCLGNHTISRCKSQKRCLKCGKKHHSLIHKNNSLFNKFNDNKENKENQGQSSSNNIQSNCASICNKILSVSKILLATAQVIVKSNDNINIKVRILIDPGSQISIISERLVQQLKLSRKRTAVTILGVGAIKAGTTRGITSIKLSPHFQSSSECLISAYILPKLSAKMSELKNINLHWSHIRGLQLADPSFHQGGTIDIIIGADYYGQILQDGVKKGLINEPTAQATIFGWILFGPVQSNHTIIEAQSFHISLDEKLHQLLERHWELNEIPSNSTSLLSIENQECEDHFKNTYTRDHDGRYIVKLPFKRSPTLLGYSKARASQFLSSLENKLKVNTKLNKAYSDFLKEYEDLEHMKLVKNIEVEPHPVYYLPHHGVIKENSISTKIRVVFNASSKTSNGISLNDILHAGAKLQNDIFNVLIWFRQFRYVFVTDMEKMYRQIKIHPDDWNLQRILWKSHDGKLVTYQLITVTYGTTSAPFLALRTVQQLIDDEGSNFPLAKNTMIKGRYVDDIFGGADTIQEAQQIVHHVQQLCMAGGFSLKKWTSNQPDVIQEILSEDKLSSASVSIDKIETIQTLGMNWTQASDNFHYSWTLTNSLKWTKRSILSTIAKCFDPLGLVSPIMIVAKIFMQDLWSLKLNWDDLIPISLSNQWVKFLQQLEQINKLSFSRWIFIKSDILYEIHGFCDASQKALAAVVYVRTMDNSGTINISLVCSKTKVAPIKKMSIPRLELCSAILLVKLVKSLSTNVLVNQKAIHLWTDSSVSFTWINSHPSKWKEFVHNRVVYIQEMLPAAKWHFVPGKENPADCATRGMNVKQLSEHIMWWNGPTWLNKIPEYWPNLNKIPTTSQNLEAKTVISAISMINSSSNLWDLLNRYSDFNKLIRITAVCKRVYFHWRKILPSLAEVPITIEEIETAKLYWILKIQQDAFKIEIEMLKTKKILSKSHCLIRLTPFLDSNGILRVGGRLQHSNLPIETKNPIILPKDSQFTKLIIADAHLRTLHGGIQSTLAYIRQKFWILGGRIPIKAHIWRCIKCFRYRQKRTEQLMGQLPGQRVNPSRPFLHSGIDYAGPFVIKTWKGRNARTYKAYIALFVCEFTSAIHLEVVTDYTTDAFIAAYKRFTSRRGICATLRSDCGTNFKGADTELQNLFSSSSQEIGKLSSLLAQDGTKWIFNPPGTPHFGGKWEAGVKSVKYHFKRITNNQILTYEKMTTLLAQIESVLNSRPLCPITNDPDDLNVLTPGHFLIGEPLNSIPEPSLTKLKLSRLSRWQMIRQILETFWVKWSKEYIQKHQTIYKWNQSSDNIKIGMLVIIIDERYPPGKWPLGRIIDVHPGRDGLTRVVTIKTQFSTFKRPITKICILPID